MMIDKKEKKKIEEKEIEKKFRKKRKEYLIFGCVFFPLFLAWDEVGSRDVRLLFLTIYF